MARPLSNDLRERAMARVAAGEAIRAIAVALSISPSRVSKWSRRLRGTGSVAPPGKWAATSRGSFLAHTPSGCERAGGIILSPCAGS